LPGLSRLARASVAFCIVHRSPLARNLAINSLPPLSWGGKAGDNGPGSRSEKSLAMLSGLDISKVLAIVCTLALMVAWGAGMAIRPQPTGPRTGQGQTLAAVKPFSPPAGFAGAHVYGLWTLRCDATVPAAPPGRDNPRCNIQGLINAKRADNRVISLVAVRVVLAGPTKVPYLIFLIPARARGDGTILFAIDENNAFRAPLKGCTATTCRVEAPMPAQALNQMLGGRSFRLQMALQGAAQPAKLIYPLHGFREAYQALALAE
jgi:invasion protein IalB